MMSVRLSLLSAFFSLSLHQTVLEVLKGRAIPISLWILIGSIIGGLLLLALIIFAMWKVHQSHLTIQYLTLCNNLFLLCLYGKDQHFGFHSFLLIPPFSSWGSSLVNR